MLIEHRFVDQCRSGRPTQDLRCRRLVAERGVRPHGIVVPPPLLDHDLGLGQRVEDLAVEQFVSEFTVERFHVAVLPRAAGFDLGGLGPDRGDPFAQRRSDELRPII